MKEKQTEHSLLSPSTCERWWHCPRSVQEIAKLPPQPANFYMAEGTVAHSVAERIVKGIIAREHKDMYEPIVGTFVKQEGFKVPITSEMIDAAYEYADYILGTADAEFMPYSKIRLEQRVVVDESLRLFGTSDCVMAGWNTLFIDDFKYGAGTYVPVADNKQLRYYALGAYKMLTDVSKPEITRIRIGICQPRMKGTENEVIPVQDILGFEQELIKRAERTKDPAAEFNAGPWCVNHFCPIRNNCPAFKAYRDQEAQIDLEAMAAEYVVDNSKALALVTDPAPEKIAQLYSAIPMIEDFVSQIKEAAMRYGMANQLPGYKVVQNYGNRKLTVTEAELKTIFGDTIDLYDEPKLKSPKGIEREIQAYNRLHKDDRIDLAVMKQIAAKPATSLAIVPESDSRPAFKPDVLEDFRGEDIIDTEIVYAADI